MCGTAMLQLSSKPVLPLNAFCLCREEVRGAKVESLSLDLADLQSVRDLANRCLDMGHPLDVLINNAVRVESVLSAQVVLVQTQAVGTLAPVAAPAPLRVWGSEASGPFSWPERATEACQVSLRLACRPYMNEGWPAELQVLCCC